MDARRLTWCLDCALAVAGVRTSGRSARSAATHRRRVNGLDAAITGSPVEIDLRQVPSETVVPRPSVLNRDLKAGTREGRAGRTPAPSRSSVWRATSANVLPEVPGGHRGRPSPADRRGDEREPAAEGPRSGRPRLRALLTAGRPWSRRHHSG